MDVVADIRAAPRLESDELWFKDAIIYQLHVKAFADSNNDGIGDFAGLTEKLDYLEDLGVKVFSMTKNVIIPLLLIGMVVFAAGNVAFGFVQVGPGLGRLLLGGAVLAGGIETILLLVGGNVSTALADLTFYLGGIPALTGAAGGPIFLEGLATGTGPFALIYPTGRIRGDIHTPVLCTNQGALLDGKVRMADERPEETTIASRTNFEQSPTRQERHRAGI